LLLRGASPTEQGNILFLPSVGAKHFHSMSEDKEFSGGLGFMVNGFNKNIKWVKIQLRWMDDYTISFINHDREVVKIVKNVYCDQLIDILDYIENED
jgi:hypothetical protein